MRFLDSNVFIYVLTQSPKNLYEVSSAILKKIENGEEALISTAVIQEVVDWLEYNNRRKEVKTFISALGSYLTLKKLTNVWKDFPAAAKDAERYEIDFVDALILHMMRREKVREIYSNDRDFNRVEGIKRVME